MIPPCSVLSLFVGLGCIDLFNDEESALSVTVSSNSLKSKLPLSLADYKQSGLSYSRVFGINRKLFLLLLLLPHGIVTMVISRWSGAATDRVMWDLSKILLAEARAVQQPQEKKILFFTSCHATPFYASLHVGLPLSLDYLDCAPSKFRGYEGPSERDLYFTDPLAWLDKNRQRFDNSDYLVLASPTTEDALTLQWISDQGFAPVGQPIFDSLVAETHHIDHRKVQPLMWFTTMQIWNKN
jgi:hypothetical protein